MMPYDAVYGRMVTAVYGVDLYRSRTVFFFSSSPNGTATVAVIRMLLSRQYGEGVQP